MNAVPKVAAGIVNYKCAPLTARCLRSLLAQTLPPDQIVVVDNASGDDSLARLEAEFGGDTRIRFIANAANVGFGTAQNQAIREMDGEYYLAMNPDAILDEDYIERLANALSGQPEMGYATGLIYFCEEDGSPTPYLYGAGHWWLRGRFCMNRFHRYAWPAEELESCEVAGAAACALLYRRSMLRDLDLGGGEVFDEMFFLYNEDADFDWRARQAGWKCWFEKEAVAWHQGGATAGLARPEVYGKVAATRWLMILKNDSFASALRDLPFIVRIDLTEYMPGLLQSPKAATACLREFFAKLRDALRMRARVEKARKVSQGELRGWMSDSLEDYREFQAFLRSHPEIPKRPPSSALAQRA